MVAPYTLQAINDIGATLAIQNLFADQRGIQLANDSMVLIALNGESVDVTAGVNLGGEQALLDGSRITLQATVGVLPILPDDQTVVTFAAATSQITVTGRNADVAVARELRGIARVFEVDDFVLAKVLEELRGVGAGLSR